MKTTHFFGFVLLLLLQSCLKDTIMSTYTYTLARPVYKTSADVRNSIGNLPAVPVSAPGKMYLYGSYIFLNEKNKGIHIINNSNPASPVNEAFIAIPGCEDMAVTGTTLYADCYTDLMVLDISNPQAVVLKTYLPNLFPDRRWVLGYYVDSSKVITDWIVKDTTVTYKITDGGMVVENGALFMNGTRADFASMTSGASKSAPGGKGGSMARFAISHSHLYAVTTSSLLSLSIAQPQQPQYRATATLPWGVETIYPFKDKLFIGANSGMHIFTLEDPARPKQAGTFRHARVCDPVIAEDDYAFVTLRSGTVCQGFINQLDVVDIGDIFNPKLLKTYPLTNPHGLDKDGNWLYVCDGRDGLKVLDAADVNRITVKQTIALPDAFDVICWNKVAMVSAADGLHQFDISNVNNIRKLSHIGLQKQ